MAVKRPTASNTLACQTLRSSRAGSNSVCKASHSLDAVGSSAREPALPAPTLPPPGESWPAVRGGITCRGVAAPDEAWNLGPLGPALPAAAALPSSGTSTALAASSSARSSRQVSPYNSSIVPFHRATSCGTVDVAGSPLARPGRVPEVFRHLCQSLKPIKSGAGTVPSAKTSASLMSLPDTCLGAAPAAATGAAPAAATGATSAAAILRNTILFGNGRNRASRSSPQLRSQELRCEVCGTQVALF